MAGRFGLQRSTWSNPMYGRSSWDHHMGEEYEDVELSWTVNRAKREKQRKRAKKRKAQSFNLKAILVGIIVLEIVLLASVSVLLWKALDPAITTKQSDSSISLCKEEPCNNGVCVEAADGFFCMCRGGWEGEFCQIESPESLCEVEPCNNGVCVEAADGFYCVCRSGWEGEFCQIESPASLCKEDSCNNGVCVEAADGFFCMCRSGWEGEFCQIESPASLCKEDSCHNGVCVEAADGFYCVCRGGWEGQFCDIDVDECKNVECHPIATCMNSAGSYTCECQEGYEGDGIEECTDKDECEQGNICGPHSLSCSNSIGSYNCSCEEGFFFNGTQCDDVDECLTSPCHDFADCTNLPGNYSCACKPSYRGDGKVSCKVILCGSQEDGWALGKDVTDSGWSGGAQAALTNECAQEDSFPFPTHTCPHPGQAISNESSHLGYYSWHFKRGYGSSGQGTPFTTPLAAMAGRADGGYTGTGDSFFASFWFKAANSSGDGSKIAVLAGIPAGNDRASNYLEVYALPEGITVRTIESAPSYIDCAQTKNCGWNGEYKNVATNLDLKTWHQVEMSLTAMPVDYMDQWQYRVDGTYTFTGGAYYQTARYDNGWSYEYANRLKFEPRHANHDASFQGFFFDDIHYGVFNSGSPQNVIEEYCVSFEE